MIKHMDTIKFVISLLAIALSIGICYATLNSKVETLDKQAIVCRTDHDVVITMANDIKWIRESVGDIKSILGTKKYASIK